MRKERYDLDEESIRPYFSLDNVRGAIFDLCGRLWGITFKEVKNVPVYNDEVSTFEIFDADGSHLSLIYFDFHPRPTKRAGA